MEGRGSIMITKYITTLGIPKKSRASAVSPQVPWISFIPVVGEWMADKNCLEDHTNEPHNRNRDPYIAYATEDRI